MTYPDPNDSSASQPTPGGYEAPPIESGSNSGPVLDFPTAPVPPPQFGQPAFGPPPFGPPPFGPPPFGQPAFGPPQFGPPAGYPQPPMFAPGYPTQQPTNGMAIGSLVTSIAAVPMAFLCWGIVGVLTAIVGIVLGIVALNQLKQRPQRGKEMAIAGIAIGGLAVVLGIVMLLAIVFVMTNSGNHGLYGNL